MFIQYLWHQSRSNPTEPPGANWHTFKSDKCSHFKADSFVGKLVWAWFLFLQLGGFTSLELFFDSDKCHLFVPWRTTDTAQCHVLVQSIKCNARPPTLIHYTPSYYKPPLALPCDKTVMSVIRPCSCLSMCLASALPPRAHFSLAIEPALQHEGRHCARAKKHFSTMQIPLRHTTHTHDGDSKPRAKQRPYTFTDSLKKSAVLHTYLNWKRNVYLLHSPVKSSSRETLDVSRTFPASVAAARARPAEKGDVKRLSVTSPSSLGRVYTFVRGLSVKTDMASSHRGNSNSLKKQIHTCCDFCARSWRQS